MQFLKRASAHQSATPGFILEDIANGPTPEKEMFACGLLFQDNCCAVGDGEPE